MDSHHVKSRQATILPRMDLDPDKLTCFYGGPAQKLVGVEGAETMKKLI